MSAAKYTPERIKSIRLSLGLNQNDFGRQLGVGREWVSRLEKGGVEPSENILMRLSLLESGYPSSMPTKITYMAKKAIEEPAGNYVTLNTVTRAMVEKEFSAYLDLAEQMPGGLGWTYVQIKKHLNRDELRSVLERHPKN